MLAGYSFRPRGWALALAAAACAAGIALGQWQARRAEERRAAAERIEQARKGPALELPARAVKPELYALKRVAASGTFVPERTVFLQNRLRERRVGYEVLTPLRMSGGIHVLVNRGWVAAGAQAGAPPPVATPQGRVRVEGLARERLARAWQLRESPGARVRQNLDLAEFARESGLALQPLVLEQLSDSGDGLARDWPRPEAAYAKNEMYALQWYSLAALAAVLGVVLSFRKA